MNDDQQGTRLQRVNELLRKLAPRSSGSAMVGEEMKPSISFSERLDVVIDTYMQQENKPAGLTKAAKAGH